MLRVGGGAEHGNPKEILHAVDQLRRRHRHAHAISTHRLCLGGAEQRNRSLAHARLSDQMCEWRAVVDKTRVKLVDDDGDVIGLSQVADLTDDGGRKYDSGRVVRVGEDQNLRAFAESRFQGGEVERRGLVVIFPEQGDRSDPGPEKPQDPLVGHVVGIDERH